MNITPVPNQIFDTQTAETQPLVSVVIPAYNAEAFIAQTLESVITQTYQNLEILVVDDGSHDRTAQIVQEYLKKDSRICLLQQQNNGVVAARNLGIEKSKGELIAPLDADDIWLPNNLEQQVSCIVQSDSSVGVVYSWSFDIDENNIATGEIHAFTIAGNVYTTLLCHYFLCNGSCTLIRKASIEKVGLYQSKTSVSQGCEDWEMYLRLAEYYQFAVVSRFLVAYRKRARSLSSDDLTMANQLVNEIWNPTLQKYPHLELISRFSKSSFFLYLARQNSAIDQHKRTIFWLSKAVKVDFFTPFLRPNFYILFLKSTLAPRFAFFHLVNSHEGKVQSAKGLMNLNAQILSPSENSFSVRAQAIIGKLLHRSISFFFEDSSCWHKRQHDEYRKIAFLG